MVSKNEALRVLNENILSFWHREMVDSKSGGFYGRIDGHGTLHPKADKGIILNARILWSFSAAYDFTGNTNYKWMAERAYEYVVKYFFDLQGGGVCWMVDHNGDVINDKKQVYAQAFAMYALTEYHKINPYRRALDHSISLYNLLEKHAFDQQENGYLEAFDRNWNVLEDVRLSEKDLNATKTMNTHLHLLEAYTNLYKIWPDAGIKARLINLIELLSSKFLYANGHFKLFFDSNWKLLSDTYSFGHDIEGSWLLYEAAQVTRDDQLIRKVEKASLQMVEAALEGLDKDGGLMNEAGAKGLTDTDKQWWPQAEALVGLANAYQLSNDAKYLDLLDSVWHFIKSHLIDSQGEWFWKVNRKGEMQPEEDKAGPWKCPYHNSRALMEIQKRLFS